MEKGAYGYMDSYKRKKLTVVAAFLALIAIAVVVILFVFQTKNTYFIVVPIILSLPCAKYIVAYIIVYPFHTMERERHAEVSAFTGEHPHVLAVYDVSLASEQGFSYLDFILLYDGDIYGCVSASNKKFQKKDIQAYIETVMKQKGFHVGVSLFESGKDTMDALERGLAARSETADVSDKRSEQVKEVLLIYNV